MSFPNLNFWSNLLGTIGIEVCVVVALGVAAQYAFRRAYWQRAMWQMSIICLLLVLASEWTGVGRGAVWSLLGPKRATIAGAPITLSPNAKIYTLKGAHAFNPPAPPQKKAIWWPGWIWLAGTVVVLGRMATAQCLLLALRFRREKIVDEVMQDRVMRVAKMLGLGRKICLLRLPESISPMAFGILFPTIGLPPGFETAFNAGEQDAILAHELAHLAALDPLWFRLADFASALLWWHPLAWWARRSLHGASELAADEATALVADGPSSLANCLVGLGKKMTVSRGWGWTGVNGGFRSKLGKRVERLTRMSAGHGRPFASWRDKLVRIAATLLIVPTIVLLFGAFQTAQGEKENAWRNSWHSSPGAILLLAAAEERDEQAEKATITGLIHHANLEDAELLYEMGEYDKAELILVHILKDDPSDRIAADYLTIIKEARFKDTASDELLVWAEHEVVARADYLGYSNVLFKLGRISETKLGDELLTTYPNLADSELKQKSSRLSYTKKAMTDLKAEYGKENPKYQKALEEFQQAKDDYDNKAAAILEGIRARVDQTSNYLQIIIKNEDNIRTKRNQQTEILALKTANQTPPQETIAERITNAKLLYEMGKLSESKKILTQVLKDDPANKTAAYYLNLIKEAQFMDQHRKKGPTEIPLATNDEQLISVRGGQQESVTLGRQNILFKLNTLHINEVDYDLPLTEVCAELRNLSQKADPGGRGINFLIDEHVDTYPGAIPVARQTETTDMGSVNIKISPPLMNLRLIDVLNAIVMNADQRIQYKIEDYAVVFSPKTVELFSKVFHLDPRTFVNNIMAVSGVNSGNSAADVDIPTNGKQTDDGPRRADEGHDSFGGPASSSSRAGVNFVKRTNNTVQLDQIVRAYFAGAGVDWTDPGKSIFFNDRLGLLLVRATTQDLQLMEQAIELLGQSPPQLTIESKFTDLSPQDAKALGFEKFLDADESNLTSIMSEAEFRAAIKSIEQNTHSDFLFAPKVTTLSGRQAQIASTNASGDGPALNIVATVGSDGFSIQTVAIASVKNGNQIWSATVTRQLWDGQTLVIGQMVSVKPSAPKVMRLVFVTPTIIDPAGNRVHPDEALSGKH